MAPNSVSGNNDPRLEIYSTPRKLNSRLQVGKTYDIPKIVVSLEKKYVMKFSLKRSLQFSEKPDKNASKI